MRIACEKCGRKMEVGELLPHLVAYASKKLIPILTPLFIKALEYYWTSPTKSCFDDSMAAIANLAGIECSHCKKKTCWNPDPEIEIIQSQTKKENVISNS